MKRLLTALFVTVALASTGVRALPAATHLVIGVVRTVDGEKGILSLVSTASHEPAEFFVESGRTRLRRDGKPAELKQLSPGSPVRVYYKVEVGRCVAVEISWKSSAPPPPAQSSATNPAGALERHDAVKGSAP